MSRPAFSRLPVTVDLPLLLQALATIVDDDWHGHFNTAYFSGDWSGVALISAADALTELSPGLGEPQLRAPWRRDARWQQGLRDLALDIVSARLLRLGPGGDIHEHRDYDLGEPGADLRLHIPLFSPPHVDFMLDGQRMPMAAGECWFLDLSRPHRVHNRDRSARVHLVLDCRPGAWLEQAIVEGLPTTPAPDAGEGALLQFQRLVASDPQLSQTLQSLQDIEEFIARTMALAAERGLVFSREELRAAMRKPFDLEKHPGSQKNLYLKLQIILQLLERADGITVGGGREFISDDVNDGINPLVRSRRRRGNHLY